MIHVSSCIFTSDVKTYENRGFPKGQKTSLRDTNRVCIRVCMVFEMYTFVYFFLFISNLILYFILLVLSSESQEAE